MPGKMDVVVGTYHHVLIGFQFSPKNENEKQQWTFSPKFTDQGHDGCIKTVASCGTYLASGSTDEVIRLYNMKKNVDIGSLGQQSGTITDLKFSGKTHLLSASEDGTIAIWKCKTWECVKTLQGHRDAVNSISIHPSGRLALSVSKDKTIRAWNLLTGRSAYTTNIKSVGELVSWSPGGESYAVVSGTKLTIYRVSDSSETCTYCCPKAILAINFITEDALLLGGEFEEVLLYSIKEQTTIQSFKAHESRVKSLKSVKNPSDENHTIIFSTSSDGKLRAWDLNMNDIQRKPEMMTEIDVPGRPVCMAVFSHTI